MLRAGAARQARGHSMHIPRAQPQRPEENVQFFFRVPRWLRNNDCSLLQPPASLIHLRTRKARPEASCPDHPRAPPRAFR